MIRALLLAACVAALPAAAAEPERERERLGAPIDGITIWRNPDGSLHWTTPGEITFEDGRRYLADSEGRFMLVPPDPAAPPRDVRPAELAVTWRTLVGQRVRVVGKVHDVTAQIGVLRLQGGHAALDVRNLAPAELISLIERCGGWTMGDECDRIVTGTVSRSGAAADGEHLVLQSLTFAVPERQAPRRR